MLATISFDIKFAKKTMTNNSQEIQCVIKNCLQYNIEFNMIECSFGT